MFYDLWRMPSNSFRYDLLWWQMTTVDDEEKPQKCFMKYNRRQNSPIKERSYDGCSRYLWGYGNDRELYVFMIEKIYLMQRLYVVCCYLFFSDAGLLVVLYGYLQHEVGNLRQVLTSLDFTTRAEELLISTTNAKRPWFTMPYWIAKDKFISALTRYPVLKWVYDIVKH